MKQSVDAILEDDSVAKSGPFGRFGGGVHRACRKGWSHN